jgi:putative colanic acid biosynthesis UDP-glucose lipid carrier transferase
MNLREQSSLIARMLHLVDCFFVVGYLWLLVVWYRVPWSDYYTRLLIITFVISFVSFQSFQLYRSWRGWKFFLEFLVILKAWGTVVGLLLFYFFIFKISVAYSRVVILIWSISTPILIFILHLAARKSLRLFRQRGKNVRRAVVVGAGELGVNLVREVETMPWAGIEVLGFFDDKIDTDEMAEVYGKPLLGNIDSMNSYLELHDIDYVYIALPMRAEKKIFKILRESRSLGARIYLIPDLYLYGLHHAEIQSLGSMLILNFNPNTEWKRSFDVAFSILALIFTLPLTLLVALAVKLSDGGPVFYNHKRITSAGKSFDCLKFRTMRLGADKELEELLESDKELRREWEQTYKLKNDPRITRVGKFLRRTSLDEFPQFLNVLRGDMSVVGARPIVGGELNGFYKDSAGRYCSMKPGITGPWQVGRRSNIDEYQERVQMDDWYILNFSLWTDIKIIVKTVYCMIRGTGA